MSTSPRGGFFWQKGGESMNKLETNPIETLVPEGPFQVERQSFMNVANIVLNEPGYRDLKWRSEKNASVINRARGHTSLIFLDRSFYSLEDPIYFLSVSKDISSIRGRVNLGLLRREDKKEYQISLGLTSDGGLLSATTYRGERWWDI